MLQFVLELGNVLNDGLALLALRLVLECRHRAMDIVDCASL